MIPYLQTTSFTTAASSLLTILKYFNPNTELTREHEFKIWKNTANLPTRGSCIYALATYAKQQGLNPIVLVEKKEYKFPDYRFYRYTKEDIDHASFTNEIHLKEAQEHNIEIQEREIEFKEIKPLLKNNILLLRVNAKPLRNTKRNTSQYIVIHSHNNNHFQITDPMKGTQSIHENLLKESFESLETKKYRDHRMILFPKI